MKNKLPNHPCCKIFIGINIDFVISKLKANQILLLLDIGRCGMSANVTNLHPSNNLLK